MTESRTDVAELSEMLNAWAEQSEKYHNGDISREEYEQWRYRYPRSEAERNEASRKGDNNL